MSDSDIGFERSIGRSCAMVREGHQKGMMLDLGRVMRRLKEVFVRGLVLQGRTHLICSDGSNGVRRLYVDDRLVSETNMNPQPGTNDCFIRVAQRSSSMI